MAYKTITAPLRCPCGCHRRFIEPSPMQRTVYFTNDELRAQTYYPPLQNLSDFEAKELLRSVGLDTISSLLIYQVKPDGATTCAGCEDAGESYNGGNLMGSVCIKSSYCFALLKSCSNVPNTGTLDKTAWAQCASLAPKVSVPHTSATLGAGFYRWRYKDLASDGAFHNKGKFIVSPVFEIREANDDGAACTLGC